MNYVVNCGKKSLEVFLEQAQQVGIMSDEHSYIIMNPDFQTIDIDPYKHGGSNITGKSFKKTIPLSQYKVNLINTKERYPTHITSDN